MEKCEVQIIEEKSNLSSGSLFVHLASFDIENIEDKNEVKEKISEINVAVSNYYSEDVKTVRFAVSCNNRSKWAGRGTIINRDQDPLVYRLIKIEGEIEKL